MEDDDPEGCMVMWWNKGSPNPNKDVAFQKAMKITSSSQRISLFSYLHFLSLCCILLVHLLLVV